MLIINSLKPFYVDKENKLIRMGNFKDTAKEIEFEDDSLIILFNNVLNPISKEDLINKTMKDTGLSKEDINGAIEYLLEEKFIINYDDYEKLLNSDLNRQNMYFSMCSDEFKEWNIDIQPRILVLGLGGVGSNVSLLLSRAGFKKFTFVDCDVVEKSNLIRQLPYSYSDIGKNKTDVLKISFQTIFSLYPSFSPQILTFS